MNRILGSMRRIDEVRGAVRVEDVYDTDIGDLWSAVTEPARLARWIAAVEGDLRVGGTVQTQFTSTWEGPGRIDVCEPPKHLVVTMEPGTDDEAVIEAWLTSEGEQTRLVIDERGLPLDALYKHGAGWQAHIEDLGRYLAGGQSNWKARWTELTPAYQSLGLS
ncbi:MAG TPA: SRPBCC family protein [Candidatus Dormibacteraeota bacterium]|nr:SRPBCC family protein [Candidatus Dormibacteraeota bacterium]